MDEMHSQLVFTRPGVASASVSAGVAPALKAKEVAPFLKNLRLMLEVESREVLRWTADGKAFEIHDMKRMMAAVLPKYFKHAKYTSFQRQLNYFNFRKWTKSKAVVCTFSNPFFVRDQPYLAWRINRKKSLHHAANDTTSSTGKATATTKATAVKQSKATAATSDMVITVPRGEATAGKAPYPSPTDGYSMESELTPPADELPLLGDESLDWIDALYSSLDVAALAAAPTTPSAPLQAAPSFQDRALDFCAHV